jgi:hypothetical protein
MTSLQTAATTLFVLLALIVRGQTDTTYQTITQETGTITTDHIETPQYFAFRTMDPARWAFKLDIGRTLNFRRIATDFIINSLNDRVNLPLSAGIEYKVSPGFSLGINYNSTLNLDINADSEQPVFDNSASMLSLEGRWYHDMKRRIREGRSANNFGGKYISAELGYGSESFGSIFLAEDIFSSKFRYGIQQRWMNNGFFDMSVGLGLNYQDFDFTSLGMDYRFRIGLAAFAPGKKAKSTYSNKCDVLMCFEEQHKMLKINLIDAVDFSKNENSLYLKLSPNVSYEHKIGKSSWSIEGTLGMAYSYHQQQPGIFTLTSLYSGVDWKAQAELRWYYNLRKRILNGKSGNNLSGPFIAFRSNYSDLFTPSVHIKSVPNSPREIGIRGGGISSDLLWGYQIRLMERGFLQFKAGI